MNKSICTIYRAFFRYSQQLRAAGQQLEVRAPLDKAAFQTTSYSWVVNESASRQDNLDLLLPDILEVSHDGTFTPEALQSCVRANLAANKAAPLEQQGALLDKAFNALRILSEQMHMQQCSSSAVTNGIKIDVTSACIGKMPISPTKTRHAFTYRVRITNVGDQKAQLMSRHWVIQNDKGKVVDEVQGPGVVGNTPLLKPYDCFQYYSSAMIDSTEGAMHGSFQMLRMGSESESQQHFDAEIQPFRLIASG